MSRTPGGAHPFRTVAEARTGRRRLALNLVTVVGSALLAVYCSRAIGDDRLVAVYLTAAGIHLVSAIWTAARLAATPADLPPETTTAA